MAADSISANGGAQRFWQHATSGMRAVLCHNGQILVSRGRGSKWQISRILTVEAITLDTAWRSDDSSAARGAITRTMRAARRFAFATLLLTGTAYAESPDGATITPQVLWSKEGFWSLCWPWDAENWYVCLNHGIASNGVGSKLVYAGGMIYTLGRDRNWWVWSNGWYQSATPPPEAKPPTNEEVLRVPQTNSTITAAVAAANADKSDKGYVIEIAPGTYTNQFVETHRPMTFRAVGGPVILRATVAPSNGKAIIVTNADLEVDGLTFTGVHNGSGNGAGIRDQNVTPDAKLTIKNSLFTLNDTGVLTTSLSPNEVITVDNSKFIDNGSPSIANPHAIYVNSGKKFKITSSLFCGQLRGHDVKSRAADTEIIDSKLYDGFANPAEGCNRTGSTGRAVDIAHGGVLTITGSDIIQGTGSPNFQLMAVGLEGLTYPDNRIVITNNRIASPGTQHSTMLFDTHCIRASPGSRIENNTYENIRTMYNPASC